MKNFLLFIVLNIAFLNFINAQLPLIDVLGKGLLEPSTPELQIEDLSSVDSVIVESIIEIFNPLGSVYSYPQTVDFVSGGTTKTTPFSSLSMDNELGVFDYVKDDSYGSVFYFSGNNSHVYLGYYSQTFQRIELGNDGIISLGKNGQGNTIRTFYAYIFRNNGTVEKYSKLAENKDRYFMFLNGADNAGIYEFELEATVNSKDIEVIVPLSDNSDVNDNRIGYISLYEGDILKNGPVQFAVNKNSTNFHFESQKLNDVPGSITSIKLEIYSPIPGNGDGDSFFSGVPIINVEEKPGDEPEGCTHTQGYWKTHSKNGPAPYDDTWAMLDDDEEDDSDMMFFSSRKSWYEVFWAPVRGNVYYMLAHQYMAAYLSMLDGASAPLEVQNAMTVAEDLFNNPEKLNKEHVYLAELLDDYNNGIIGPGHCDEVEKAEIEEDEGSYVQTSNENKGKGKGKNKSAQISSDNTLLQINDLKVYPNPVTNSATIAFTPKYDGNVTLDIYNSLGQRTSRLMDRMVNKDFPVTLSINSSDFQEGLYILRVQNESSVGTKRIQIGQ